jgi:hypothetical protein
MGWGLWCGDFEIIYIEQLKNFSPEESETAIFQNGCLAFRSPKKTKLHGLSQRANYTDRATDSDHCQNAFIS